MQRGAEAQLLLLSVCLGLAAVAQGQFSWAEVSNKEALQTGDGTFYGAGQDSQGTCSFSENFANTNNLPWTTGAALTLALNDAQFDNSAGCGLCVMYRGTGAGLGTTPIPATWTMGFVNNRCPECAKGDLDQATSGDGRWKVEWYAVPCNVGSSPLTYSIVVSSYYWFSLVVSNTRYPITSVSVMIGGSYLPLKRTNNNQWAYYNTNGPWQANFPMGIQVTNCLGETVTDQITAFEGNTGTVQFSEGGGAGSGGMPASGGNATAVTAATPPALPGSLATPPPAADLPIVPPPTAAVPPPTAAVAPPTTATPPAQTPPNPLPEGSFYIENYQQCGGTGGYCNTKPQTAAPCADAAWEKATCRSWGFACSRYDATQWTCIPSNNVTFPPPPVYTANPPAPTPPLPTGTGTPPTPSAGTASNLQAAGPMQSPAAPQPPPAAATPPSPVAATPPSPVAATPPPPAADTQPPPAADTASTGIASASAASTTPKNSFLIQDYSQCGGTTQCDPSGTSTDKVNCNNGPWAGAYCNAGLSCQPDPGPLIWLCKPQSVATGGRRLMASS